MEADALPVTDRVVQRLRAFNRDFSQLMGLLESRYMGSDLSVVEARVLYEIVQREPVLARDIARPLRLDPGYLSRIVARLLRRGFVERGRGEDARERPLSLTAAGRTAYAELDRTTAAQTARMIAPLGEDGARRLGALLGEAGMLLFGAVPGEWSLRTFRTGDMGLITARQSILYHEGYGWGRGMEALIGEITAAFLRDFKSGREQCWIAEREGRMLGSVFLVEEDAETARLRLLYVEPEARGMGVGQALVKQCTAFAREAGYRRIVLWTHAVLESARRIYVAEGYRIAETHTHDDFGKPELSESWLLEL
ncbi:bifunctional helix-turn-helix transcriptional regulator/GNAT family N-acetyltransferase [Altererythrobacter sp. C41]|uniref:bifunctional helix-turn-helix transcriptional regulator/GNAT family N-acetyltransferase n=1 Tax=Altererythrobacter sp. C41 TaxID=2806021 RepID=UPI00193185DB|nr:bifunctional helix-turn-helix transcriptional regulator/GNAT family N-acetyltransferase [Altererythrobacter sp. C41]MBM0169971.1 MarR family transcriptional regulator [Altererythrobacter sp. C41]